jgi:hypothetical protein
MRMRTLDMQKPGRRRIVIQHPDGRIWVRHSRTEAARVIQAIPLLAKLYPDIKVTVSGEVVSYAIYARWSRKGFYPALPPPDAMGVLTT